MQLESPRSGRALRGPGHARSLVVTATTALLLVLASVWSTAALALPPGGPSENRGGAVIKLTSTVVKPVTDGDAGSGLVRFSGTGFAAGEVLLVKIDDGAVAPNTATRPPAPAGVAPQSNDWIQLGVADAGGVVPETTVDLRNVVAGDAAKVAAGKHLLRFVSSRPRSIHADFVVRPIPGGVGLGVADGGTAKAFVGPGADQPIDYIAGQTFDDIPSFVPGSLVPYRLTGLPANQVISVKIDNGGTGNPYNPPAPRTNPLTGGVLQFDVWDSFRTDANGNAQGLLPIPTDASFSGAHIVRFLGAADATVTPAIPGRSVWAAFAVDGAAPARSVAAAASAQRGRSVRLTGSGLLKSPFYIAGGTGNTGDGQTVTARIDGTGTPFHVRANDDGTLAADLPIPAGTSLGTHRVLLWVGFRAGSDFPQTVQERTFEVTEFVPEAVVAPPVVAPPADSAPPAVVPPAIVPPAPVVPAPRAATVSSSALKATKAGRVPLSLVRPSVATKVRVSVVTKAKIRVAGRRTKKLVTLVKATTVTLKAGTAKQRTALSLKLTKEGRAALKKARTLKVVVRVAPTTKGAKAVTKTVNLRG